MHFDQDGGAQANGVELPVEAGNSVDTDAVVSLVAEDDAFDDAGEQTEANTNANTSTQSEEAAEDKPRRRSRTQRYKDRITRLTAELEAERRRPRAPEIVADEASTPDTEAEAAQAQARRESEAALRERMAGYSSRLAALKPRIPDFDAVVREAGHAQIRDDVRDLVLGSPKGPLIAYYLAKNPEALDDLNRMPPTEAARRIGNLEARIRGPSPSTATRAGAPLAPPRGGAAPPRALDPERMSHEEYRKARAAGRI